MSDMTSRFGERRPPVAVIGIAGQYPDADDLQTLHDNLSAGHDAVRPLDAERREACGIPEAERQITGHLRRVDLFDHELFGISLGEAEHIDPQQRMMLETVCKAIQNAGYSLRSFRGTRTALILAAPHSGYYLRYLAGGTSSASVFGNAPAMMAGRIMYLLDLRGPAMMVDTTCSSSLLAIHEACTKLWMQEAELALAGGVNLKISFQERPEGWGEEVLSADGRSKTFDAAADGTGVGEGVGAVLLKPLARAIADGDVIHAVVRGSAANNDGARSNGMTAPSSDAQTEVVLAAWDAAGIDPAGVGYVEVHGTGTVVGDPIEVRGLINAFARRTKRRAFCALSALKSNIGHTGYAAGIASFTKAVLALKHAKLYPTLHFRSLNPLITLDDSAVYVNTELRDWPRSGAPRHAAVSSFGMAGTNVHVVLEEPPAREVRGEEGGAELFVVSARDRALLERYASELLRALGGAKAHLPDISFVLTAGRDRGTFGDAFVAGSRAELMEKIAELPARATALPTPGSSELLFLLPGDGSVSNEELASLALLDPVCREAIAECQGGDDLSTAPSRLFAAMYASYKLWAALGLVPKQLVGCGLGNFVIGAVRGRLGVSEAAAKARSWRSETMFDREQLARALDDLRGRGPVSLLSLAGQTDFVRQVEHQLGVAASTLATVTRRGALEQLASLVRAGAEVDWISHFAKRNVLRVELPPLPMRRTRCWVRQNDSVAPASQRGRQPGAEGTSTRVNGAQVVVEGERVTESMVTLGGVWAEILKVDGLRAETSFEDVGGDSLSALDVAARVREVFGVKLSPHDFVQNPRLFELAARIDALRLHTSAVEVRGDSHG